VAKPEPQPPTPADKPEKFDPRKAPHPVGEGAWILSEAYRWTVIHGRPPEPEDWDPLPGMPTSEAVKAVFGDWDGLWEEAGFADAAYLRDREEGAAASKGARKAETEARRERKRLADEASKSEQRLREMRRQVELQKEKAAEAAGELAAARGRAERAEARVSELEQALADGGREVQAPDDGASAAEVAELADRLASSEANAESLGATLDSAMAELDAREEELAAVRRALHVAGAGQDASEGDAAVPADPPRLPDSVREAVEMAVGSCSHLVFAPRALESAEDSPFTRPALILENLERLDALAGLYLAGDIGERLSDVAFRHRLAWRGGVSDTTRQRHAADYLVTLGDRVFPLGPHVRIGSGKGAGDIARIYLCLHPGDDETPRAVIVGHVGRHLPDSTT
jgi:hypothetical protein